VGLDTVELVMAVEDHFDIVIPDHVAEGLFTVGALHSFVVSELSRLGRDANATIVFADLRLLIVEHLHVKPEEVTMEARFVKDLRVD
jgi:acyl carrier protein